jgi:formamidopyrimidine-DNA glycosylase
MPELPEVETVANSVDRHVRGDTIVSAWFSSHKEPFRTPPASLTDALTGRRIAHVRRVGKHIVVDLEEARHSRRGAIRPAQAQFLVHLGMTGQLLVTSPQAPAARHTHAILHLESGRELRFVDPRRFGRLALAAEPFTGPGTEPLTVGPQEFAALFRGRKLSIKSALLNQKLLHGVGNIYADESLFRARIRPTRRAGRLRLADLERLRKALQKVLRAAIQAGGSSISDYVDANGEPGFFQVQHRVYGRAGQPCRICGTPIRRIVLGGRSSHFCPHCQT